MKRGTQESEARGSVTQVIMASMTLVWQTHHTKKGLKEQLSSSPCD